MNGRLEALEPAERLAIFAVLSVVAAGMFLWNWVGYLESDDFYYAAAAQNWVHHFPYLGTSHWALRHTIVMPMAALFALFGPSEVALVAPIAAYAACLLVLTYSCVAHAAGRTAACIAVLILSLVPALVPQASIVFDDIPECAFVTGSLWCFYFASRDDRYGLFLLAGALAGFGFITRETTLALLVFYGILFLFNGGRVWRPYLIMAAGFALIVGADTLLLGIASGDPLYRLHVSLAGVRGDNPETALQLQTVAGFDRFGTIAVPRWLQPIVILFLNQNFGLLFWAAVPATIFLCAARTPSPQRTVARLFGGLALVWLLTLSYGFIFLWVQPRYFLVVAVACVVPLAILLGEVFEAGQRVFVAAVLAVLSASCIVLLVAADTHVMFGEKTLVAFLKTAPAEPVETDAATLQGAAWLLDNARLADRVASAPPAPGTIYFFNSNPHRYLADESQATPGADWRVIARFDKPPNAALRVIRFLGLARFVPGPVLRKLDPPPRFAIVYQIPR